MSRVVRSIAIVTVAVLFFCTLASAQADKPGSKDHPLFTRMPGYYIADYVERQFDAVNMPVKEGTNPRPKPVAVEGRYYAVFYRLPKGTTTPASTLQIVRNFGNAAKAVGGEVLFEGGQQGAHQATVKITKGGSEAWAWIEAHAWDYKLTIVEKQAMKQDVVADAASFARDLSATGKVAVYGIYFDTAKAELKPESELAIGEIAKLLKQDPSLRLFVVGHTDTVGDPAMNLKLSQARAQSVVSALTTKHGIPASRLLSFGAGPYAPVASNKDEEGRAKNRRVELVDMSGK